MDKNNQNHNPSETYDISIIGRQEYEGESDLIEVNTTGTYGKKGDVRYIKYNEYDEEQPEVAKANIIKVEKDKVTLIRPNSVTRLILEPGKRHLCLYDMGYGNVTLGVFTDYINSTLTDTGGRLDVRYTLDIDSNLSSVNMLTATVTRRKEKKI